MCTVKNERQVMVCDVSRDVVARRLDERVGGAASMTTVHGEGTLFSCSDPARLEEFQASVGEALGWRPEEARFSA